MKFNDDSSENDEYASVLTLQDVLRSRKETNKMKLLIYLVEKYFCCIHTDQVNSNWFIILPRK